jgi:hypothetical protein
MDWLEGRDCLWSGGLKWNGLFAGCVGCSKNWGVELLEAVVEDMSDFCGLA